MAIKLSNIIWTKLQKVENVQRDQVKNILTCGRT